jgi:hypothetical protein
MEVALVVSNLLSQKALTDGISAYFGWKMCSSQGSRLVTPAFVGFNIFQKWRVVRALKPSSFKRHLTILALVFIVLELVVIGVPLPAVAITTDRIFLEKNDSGCIEYKELGAPSDKGYPTVREMMGFAEFATTRSFGYSRPSRKQYYADLYHPESHYVSSFESLVGKQRSKTSILIPDYEKTTIIVGPQSLDGDYKEDANYGSGISASVLSSCSCLDDASSFYAKYAIQGKYNALTQSTAMVSKIVENVDNVVIGSVFKGIALCSSNQLLTCETTLADYYTVKTLAVHSTSGSFASKKVSQINVNSVTNTGDFKWLAFAAASMLEEPIDLQPTVPDLMNPLLWWTVSDQRSKTLEIEGFNQGIEVMMSILLRGGVERTYSESVGECFLKVALPDESRAFFAPYGHITGILIVVYHLLVLVTAFVYSIPWLLTSNPCQPGIRLLKDEAYFAVLLREMKDVSISGMSKEEELWRQLDTPCRIGEANSTVNDFTYGQITLGAPDSVSPFVLTKRYE